MTTVSSLAWHGIIEAEVLISSAIIVLRVLWLRAKAKRDRWQEELTLLQHEMKWTVNAFKEWARQWEARRSVEDEGTGDVGRGKNAYAHRQEAMWRRKAEEADKLFAMAQACRL
jgi:hypothetical protein